MGRKRRPSMHDVAERAGVSQTTVSLVLNDAENSGIPDSTKERVRQAVLDVGYRTNRLARAMRLDRTDTLGFVSDDIATTPYANEMIRGAQDAAWAAGLLLLIVNTGAVDDENHSDNEMAAVDHLLERQVDGIILAAMYHRVLEPPAGLSEVRSVLLDAKCRDSSISSVVPDEFTAGYNATAHLISNGHTRIAHLTTNIAGIAEEGRAGGFRQAMADHELPVHDELIVRVFPDPSGGREGADQLFDLSEPPTAIFSYTDRLAMGVYQAANRRGVSIPEDISIVGFDDQELVAPELLPSLTTMRLPHYEMGHWAVTHLLAGDAEANLQEILPCPLVERNSVAPPSASRG